MQNEFKYIPYDRKDTNIRGLIKNGNVYNLTRSIQMRNSQEQKRTGPI